MNTERTAILVVDLAYGDCGKGTICDFLTRRHGAHMVVRFNGGPQAGHNIITPDGRHHTFAQIGAGAFLPGIRTLLSRFMLIEPYALFNETAHLEQLGVPDPLERLLIDQRCAVITPAHQAANRLLEISRGDSAHGTCGMGIGQTMADLIEHPEIAIRAADLSHRATIVRKLRSIRELKLDQLRDVISAVRLLPRAQRDLDTLLDVSWISSAADRYREVADRARLVDPAEVRQLFAQQGTTVFEGAQGVLLDESFGFHPHTTWSNTTFANADAVLDEAGFNDRRTRIGVLRAYFTRHGAGPLVTEDASLLPVLPEPHNDPAGWQGRFRVGVFDAVAARYAIGVAGPLDMLAVTHLDRLGGLPPKICTRYRLDSDLASEYGGAVADGFEVEDRSITAIRPKRPATLADAEARTELVRRCGPVYTPAPVTNTEAFVDHLSRVLQVPVRLGSHGPASHEKRIRE